MNILKTHTATAIKLFTVVLVSALLIGSQNETAAESVAATSLSSDNYTELSSPLDVSTGDKIEVTELFWYGCGHCFALEPFVDEWKKGKAENVEFVKVPAIFSKRWEFHGKAFYTMEALGVLDKANEAFFHRIHVMRKGINDLEALSEFLSAYDKSAEEVAAAFNSFDVDNKLRNAKIITAKSTAQGVPAFLVDG
jgi:thiol:disulfide interchange protein DsbA